MKIFNTITLLIFLSLNSYGQVVKEIDIESIYLNETKVVRIFIPEKTENLQKKFPLTLILDSELLFESYVSSAKLFSESSTNPDQIIVGIKQPKGTDKDKDYGYDHVNSYPNSNSINTIAFIKKELLPTLKRRFNIANFKTIVGSGASANFLNYFLFDVQPIFNAYVSINPELAPDMPVHLQNYTKKIERIDTYYYLSHGNENTKKNKRLVDDTNTGLENVSNVYFNYKYEDHKNSSTIVSTAQSLASAQEYIFSMYSPISTNEFKNNISYLSPAAAIQYLLYKYENIEFMFGEKLPIRKQDFVSTEPVILEKENGEYLEEYGELVLKEHPKDALGDYYIGQYYEKQEMYNEALLSYKKGFAKIPSSSPRSYGYYMNIKRVSTLKKLQKEEQENSDSESEPIEQEITQVD